MSVRAADPQDLALAEVLQSLSEPLLVLGADRRVTFANAAASAMLKRDEGLSLRGTSLTGEDQDIHDRLARAIAAAAASAPGNTFALLLKQQSDGRCAVLHLSPMAGCQAAKPFQKTDARILARVCLNAAWLSPDIRAVQETFGLSRAEAEIAILIAAGNSPRRIANKRLSSEETVRWHIKNIYSKTCTNRLVDLVLQLRAARPPFFVKEGAGCDGTLSLDARDAKQLKIKTAAGAHSPSGHGSISTRATGRLAV